MNTQKNFYHGHGLQVRYLSLTLHFYYSYSKFNTSFHYNRNKFILSSLFRQSSSKNNNNNIITIMHNNKIWKDNVLIKKRSITTINTYYIKVPWKLTRSRTNNSTYTSKKLRIIDFELLFNNFLKLFFPKKFKSARNNHWPSSKTNNNFYVNLGLGSLL